MEEARARDPDLLVHAANSAATLREPAAHFDMVRCGIADLRPRSLPGRPGRSRSRARAGARVLGGGGAATSSPATSAGYGRTWRAESPTAVATVPIGYGDGWRRGLSNDCDVLIGGRRHPLVGTVSMDNVTVDLGPRERRGGGRRP